MIFHPPTLSLSEAGMVHVTHLLRQRIDAIALHARAPRLRTADGINKRELHTQRFGARTWRQPIATHAHIYCQTDSYSRPGERRDRGPKQSK